jgi:hypothetical protein
MSTRDQKILALLASTTNEGEAMSAWRKLRAARPEGDLFGPSSKPLVWPDTDKIRRAAYNHGYQVGQAEIRDKVHAAAKKSLQAEYQAVVTAAIDRHKRKLDAENREVLARLLREETVPRKPLHLGFDVLGSVVIAFSRFGWLVIAILVFSEIAGRMK